MQLSTLLATTTLASGALALSIPSVNLWPRASLTVSSDTGSVNVDVTAATDSDVGGKADAASAVAGVVNQVVQLIQGMVDDDIKRRQAFTQNTAARTQAALGGNVIVSNVGYALDSTNSKTFSTSYNAKIGSDVTFDVVSFGSGSFTLKGDGGFENWAYMVSSACTVNGKTITC